MDLGLRDRVYNVADEEWRSAFESIFLGAIRIARAVAKTVRQDGSIAFVLSSSVRSPIPGLAISNGLRPGLGMVAKTLSDERSPGDSGQRTDAPHDLADLLRFRAEIDHRAARPTLDPARRHNVTVARRERRRPTER